MLHLALEQVVSTFEPRPGLEPFHLPSSPISLADVGNLFFEGDDDYGDDAQELWNRADSDLVISLGWNGGPGGSSSWGLWATPLPSRRRVYVEVNDWSDAPQVLAATLPTSTPLADDIRFLELLASDNGEALGTGVVASVPDEISIGPKMPKKRLIDVVLRLLKSAEALDELREEGSRWREHPQPTKPPAPPEPWLEDIRREFGPNLNSVVGMAFDARVRAYRKAHGIPEPVWEAPPVERDASDFSDREVVEGWLRRQGVLSNRRMGRA
jgi:hypothetical protein